MSNYTEAKSLAEVLSPPEWVAISYAEHLEQCAADTTQYLNALTELVDSEEFVDRSIEIEDQIDVVKEAFTGEVASLAEARSIDLATIDRESEEFADLTQEAWSNIENVPEVSSWTANLTLDEKTSIAINPYGLISCPSSAEIAATKAYVLDEMESYVNERVAPGNIPYFGGYYDARRCALNFLTQAVFTATPAVISAIGGYTDSAGVDISITDDIVSGFSITGITSELASSAGAALSCAGFFRSIPYEDIADRVSAFSNYIQSKGEGLLDNAKLVVSACREKISDLTCTISDALDWYADITGLKALAQEAKSLKDTDMYQFLGASPVPTFGLNCAKTLGKVVGVTVAMTAYGAYAATRALVKLVGKWTKKIFHALVSPDDLTDRKDPKAPGRGFVANWVQSEDVTWESKTLDFPDFATGQIDIMKPAADRYVNWLHQLLSVNGGCAIHFRAGEMILAPTSSFQHSAIGSSSTRTFISGSFNVQFKPACINIEALYQMIHSSSNASIRQLLTYVSARDCYVGECWFPQNEPISTAMELCDIITSFFMTDNAYLPLQDPDTEQPTSEKKLFAGYLGGFWLSALSIAIMANWMADQQHGAAVNANEEFLRIFTSEGTTYIQNAEVLIPGAACFDRDVTNKDYVSLLAGWNGDPSDPQFGQATVNLYDTDLFTAAFRTYARNSYYPWASTPIYSVFPSASRMGSAIALLLFDQRCDRVASPADFLYLPYSSSVVLFSFPDWQVATDNQNALLATAFLTLIGVVVLTVAITATVKIAGSLLAKKKLFKLEYFKSQMDAALWDDKCSVSVIWKPGKYYQKAWHLFDKADKKHMKYYMKITRKLEALSAVSDAAGAVQHTLVSRSVDLGKNVLASATPVMETLKAGAFDATPGSVDEFAYATPGVAPSITKVYRSIVGHE